MKIFFVFFIFAICSTSFSVNQLPPGALNKVKSILQNENACFTLKERSAPKPEIIFGKPLCEEAFSLGNRDLFPIAAIATDLGLIQDEKTLFKWDGTRYPNKLWNKDQFVTDWIQNQVSWVTDRLRLQIGSDVIKKYLKLFSLEEEPSTLQFSAFSERFFSGKLSTPKAKHDLVQRFFYIGKYRYGTEVWGGKSSGSGYASFSGHLVLKNQAWTFSTFIKPSKASTEPLTAERAQALSMDILTELGLF